MLFFKSFLYKLKRGCSKNYRAVGTSHLTDQNNIASKCRWTVLSPYWKPVHRDWRGESSVNSCLTGMKAGAQISRHLGMAAWQLIPVFGKWRCRGHRARQLSKLALGSREKLCLKMYGGWWGVINKDLKINFWFPYIYIYIYYVPAPHICPHLYKHSMHASTCACARVHTHSIYLQTYQ